MASTLDSIIRLNRHRLDERRRELADRQRDLDGHRERLSALEAEVEAEKTAAVDKPLEGDFQAYYHGALLRRGAIQRDIAGAEARVAEASDAVAEQFRELKTFEIAEENRAEAAALEAKREEGRQLDEVAIIGHRRKGDG